MIPPHFGRRFPAGELRLLSVTGQPYRYSHEIACRSEYTGMEDASSPLRIFDFLDVGFQLGLVFFLKKNRTQNTFRSLEFGATNLDVDLAAAPAKFSMGIQHQYVNG